MTSAFWAISSAMGLSTSWSSTLFHCARSLNRNGASMNGAAFEKVDMWAGHDGVVDRDALVHVGEIVLLEPELRVLVKDEVDRLAPVLLRQVGELRHRLGEGMVVVELRRPVQRDLRLRLDVGRGDGGRGEGETALQNVTSLHGFLRYAPSFGGIGVTIAERAPRANSLLLLSPLAGRGLRGGGREASPKGEGEGSARVGLPPQAG